MIECTIAMGIVAIVLLAVGALHLAALRTWSWGLRSCTADSHATVPLQQIGPQVREAIRVTELTPTALAVILPQKDATGHNVLLSTGVLQEGSELKYYLGNALGKPDVNGHVLYQVRRPAAQSGQLWDYSVAKRLGPEGATDPIAGVRFEACAGTVKPTIYVGISGQATYAGDCAVQMAEGKFGLHNAP